MPKFPINKKENKNKKLTPWEAGKVLTALLFRCMDAATSVQVNI